MAKFPFSDLHSFKDYIVFVQICASDNFPLRENLGPEDQWTLDLAFKGLRYGLKMAIEEKGPKPVFSECEKLVDEAYDHYCHGREREGFHAMESIENLLRKIPTQ